MTWNETLSRSLNISSSPVARCRIGTASEVLLLPGVQRPAKEQGRKRINLKFH